MADVMAPPQIQLAQAQQSPQQPQPHPQTSLPDAKPKMPPPTSTTPVNMSLNNASRRPPRKSTLTQQQKNQKRQRATQDQLMTLEVEFNKNPTPTALVRERIAQEINMTERSVQIWFQNRRAKIKNIAKRSIENGEDCDNIPESMRQYLAMQAYGTGKGIGASLLSRAGHPAFAPYSTGSLCLNTDASSGKVVIQHFHCRSLTVGTWRRVGQSTMDLVIFYSPDKACVTYYINNENAGYKIEYPFAWIKNISLEQGDVLAPAEGASQRSGGLVIELTRPPKFWMDSSGSGGFYECGDFTEDQQASRILTHHLGGPSKVLSGQLAKLVSLEAYQNRHQMFDLNPFAIQGGAPPPPPPQQQQQPLPLPPQQPPPAASAPVSPVGPRPASQPNHMMHPHNAMHLFPPQEHAPGMMGPPGPRGHKRQRSRSVPVAVDVSMLRHPMPSFLIQQEGHPAPHPVHDPNIFAPVPQHQHPHNFGPGPVGPNNLSVDTSAGFGMGFHFGAPLSATTANSPSEFGTPAFFSAGHANDGMHPPHFNPSFNQGFLAVDPANMIGTSNTPLSVTSHGDPVIADHSPPLNGVGRSQSADLFGTPGDHSHISDEGLYLSETFTKQIALPFRSPMTDEGFNSPLPDGMFNFQSPPASGPDAPANMNGNGQQAGMNFQSPPQQSQDGGSFHSPPTQGTQSHQDSGIAFSTPSHMSHDQGTMFTSPKDSSMLYQDSKMYTSPGQLHQLPDDSSLFHNSPLEDGSTNGMDINPQQIFGFVDPHSLGQPPQ